MPIATDIAFALAVLAVLSTHLPTALRTFLLTLAVVDDLLAITVIAVFFTDHLLPGPLALALVPGGLFALAVQRGVRQWWVLLPLARRDVGAGARQRHSRDRCRACCWASRFRFWAGMRRRNRSNTGCGRCPPASPFRSSRSSPPA